MKKIIVKRYQTSDLSDTLLQPMHELFIQYYNDPAYDVFVKDIKVCKIVFIAFDATDNHICGYICMRMLDGEFDNRQFRVFIGGKTVVKKECWGKNISASLFAKATNEILKYYLTHPLTTIYAYFASTGYKTYLFFTKNGLSCWPTYKNHSNPKLKKICYYITKQLYPNTFNEKTGLIDFTKDYSLKDPDTFANKNMAMHNKDIEFFLTINPTWHQGHGVPMIVRVSAYNLVYAVVKFFLRKLGLIKGTTYNANKTTK